MKAIRFSVLMMSLLCCTLTFAQKGKKAVKKSKGKTEAVKRDVKLPNIDSLGYALGVANSQGLKPFLVQRLNVDTTANMNDFMRGIDDYFKNQNNKEQVAYYAGLTIAPQIMDMIFNFNKNQCDGDSLYSISVEKFLEGFKAASLNNNPKYTPKQAQDYLKNGIDSINKKKEIDAKYVGNMFLSANAKKKGVVTLPSGLQYKIITKGTGAVPVDTSFVKVNYEGRLLDGTVFDSSYKRNEPAEFGVTQVIKGWTEALKLMPVGSKWELYIPENLAYGSRSQGSIPAYSTLVFTVELLDIVEKPAKAAPKHHGPKDKPQAKPQDKPQDKPEAKPQDKK